MGISPHTTEYVQLGGDGHDACQASYNPGQKGLVQRNGGIY